MILSNNGDTVNWTVTLTNNQLVSVTGTTTIGTNGSLTLDGGTFGTGALNITGGMFPGTAFVLAARYSPSPAQMALMAGFMLQGAGIGQTIGPLMVSSTVEYYNDWNMANLVVVAMAGIGLGCALLLRKRSST